MVGMEEAVVVRNEVELQEEDLNIGNPRYALRLFIGKTQLRHVYNPEYSRKIATCWNAHCEGKELFNIKTSAPPIRIFGTPFDGRRFHRVNVNTLEIEPVDL